ncbi:MAG: sulfatase-like hydrolase/transferase, partial [Akkermansiaceae bacterium]|nr:sulfatase-like hydrolase/transferase [Akkermansiaceae bacterium]
DPHKPFWKPADQQGSHKVSRIFRAREVPIPGFLFDDPLVREELALYYTSVRRADDAVGSILGALKESGREENTVVIFLSDHGMPLPFAKTQLYHHSTRTPLIVRWPGITRPGAIDGKHMVSAVDLLPTILDMAGLKHPRGFDGRSFLPVIKGNPQESRDSVFKVYNENAGGNRHPIRGVQTRTYLYLFNPWSDGVNVFRTATNGTATYRQMKKLAPTNPSIAARLQMMDHRTVEELYDVRNDPDCLRNLVEDPKHAAALREHRTLLENHMVSTNDHALAPFRKRNDPTALAAYMKKVQDASNTRRAKKRRKKRTAQPGRE